jgi:hypothetical protein
MPLGCFRAAQQLIIITQRIRPHRMTPGGISRCIRPQRKALSIQKTVKSLDERIWQVSLELGNSVHRTFHCLDWVHFHTWTSELWNHVMWVKRLPNVHLTAMLFFLSQLMTNPDTRNWPRVGNPTRGTGRYLPVQMETWEIFLGVGRRQGKSPVTHSWWPRHVGVGLKFPELFLEWGSVSFSPISCC